MPTTICHNEKCLKEFYYRSKGRIRRFCSTQCAYPDSYCVSIESNCPICNEPFIKVESNNKNIRRITCGKQRCQKSRKNHPNYSHKVDVLCSGCNKTFQKTSGDFYNHLAKGHKRHFCSVDCLHNSQFREFTAKRIENLVKRGLDPCAVKMCAGCKVPKSLEEFSTTSKPRSLCKKCLYKHQSKRWLSKKLSAISYLGGRCIDCGYNKHWAAFDFHHRDPNSKEYDWRKLRLRSDESIKKELDKCDLLCCICHRIRHASGDHSLADTRLPESGQGVIP